VQDVFAAALDVPPPQRAALLNQECAGDETLRREVASLLASHDATGAVDRLSLEVMSPAVQRVRSHPGMEPGRVVSHYVILDTLGGGGMGVVCRARDERLHRLIALKFLPPHLAADEPAKRRFLLEARAAAALEHPNVCTIFEIGETPDGQLFIAMPLYDGETLQARLARGPLPLEQSISIAREVSAGLAAAHQSGIVHRDVKPSNIMLLPDGRLKILDFGVAKVKDVTMTASGTPIGTVTYMSPEQARGEQVDHRTDIWAVGVVLYEMLTGRPPFTGDTASAIVHAIGTRQPAAASSLRERLPQQIDDVIETALAKTPERRFAAISDIVAALDALQSGTRPARSPERSASRGSAIAMDDASIAPTAERRRATVLVTLISDYPSLLERLDPAGVEELVGRLRAAAVDAVRRHGGLVNQALGEEIVSLFGIPATQEDDDIRAVRAALELHARAPEISTAATASLGLTLTVQSGIHSGSAVAQRLREGPRRYAVSGAPVQVAARLASLAGRGAVLISPDCQRIVSPFVETEPGRPIELQPEAPPLTPHRVLRESGVHTRIEAAERSGLTPFTGRAAELAALQGMIAEARSGHGRIVLVVGEPGMGKSRIVHELRERLRGDEIRVLLGRGRSYGGGISPYMPVVDVIRELLDAPATGPAPDVAQVVQRIRAADASLEPFVPLYLHLLSIASEAFPVPRHLDGEHLHAALLDAVAALVMVAAQRSPLLLLLEDWHWADDASREVLRRLAEVVDSQPIGVIVTTRPDAAVLSAVAGEGSIVQLGPLDRSGAAAVLQALLGGDAVSRALVDRVHDRTGGNPFFLEQVALTLREEGAVVNAGGETTLAPHVESLRLPDTVEAVIRARLDRLDGDSREVLRVASVIGREFGRGLLLAAVPAGIDTGRALDRLRAAALIQQVRVIPEPAFKFKHVLTQEVAYGSLLEHQRKALHGAIGCSLEVEAADRADEHSEALAHHFIEAEAWNAAVRYGRRAAERLRALSQYANALSMLDRVQGSLAHLPDDDARRNLTADILLEQERLCETLGQRRRQQQIIGELISRLAPHGASARLAEAYLRQGDVLILLKRYDAADRALNTVLRLSREHGDAALERNALRSIGLLRWHQGRHEEALTIAETTLEIDRALGDEIAIAVDLGNIGNILRGLGQYERARTVLEEAVAMPVLEQNPARLSAVLHNLANVHRANGDLARALDYLQRSAESMRVNLLPVQRCFHLTAIAHIRLQQGQIDEALKTYREAVELSRRARTAEGLAQSLRLLGELNAGLGQDSEAAAHLAEAAGLFAQLEDVESEAQAWTQVAGARERLGELEGARDAWASVRRIRQALGDRAGELDALEGLGRAARRLGTPQDAIGWLEEALTMADALRDVRRLTALHNTLGIIQWERGRFFEALGHYESGLQLCREAGDRAHEGLMLNSVGVTLERLHRHEEARTVLEESVALNAATGERLLEAHALTALADVSVRLGRAHTARECLERSLAIRQALGDEEGAALAIARLTEIRAGAASNSTTS
jgi:predicted ATPase/serine/threonine protein kinase